MLGSAKLWIFAEPDHNFKNSKKRDPDTINWQHNGTFKKGKVKRKAFKKKGQKNFKCFNCRKKEHYAKDCYSKRQNKSAKTESEALKQERKFKQKKHPERKWDKIKTEPEDKIVSAIMRPNLRPLLRSKVQQYRETTQQIANILALCPLTDLEQKHIYWVIIERNLS
jgi:hypothetical protein